MLVLAAVLLGAAAIFLPAILDYMGEEERDLHALSPAEAQAIHPLLVEASLGGNWPALLVGELDASRWAALDDSQRRQELRTLIGGMRARGVENALLYYNGILAVNIVSGEAHLIE